MHSVIGCFILFVLCVLFNCSILSSSVRIWKEDNKSFTKIPSQLSFLSRHLSFSSDSNCICLDDRCVPNKPINALKKLLIFLQIQGRDMLVEL